MKPTLILNPITKLQVESIIKNKNIHSVGIYGPSGAGKKYLSDYIASKLIGEIDINNYPYLFKLDCDTKKIGIDEVRELKKFLELKIPSSKQKSRCVILTSAEKLSVAAQNTLLKTIEEPPRGTIIVISATDKNHLLKTISSRLQWISVKPVKADILKEYDNIFVDNKELNKAIILSEGNVGDFFAFSTKNKEINSYVIAIDYAKELIKKTKIEKLASIDEIIKNENFTVDEFLRALTKIIRTLLLKSDQSKKTDSLINKLELITETRYLADKKISNKLILTRLFNKV